MHVDFHGSVIGENSLMSQLCLVRESGAILTLLRDKQIFRYLKMRVESQSNFFQKIILLKNGGIFFLKKLTLLKNGGVNFSK